MTATTQHDRAGHAATAIRCVASSRQHQTKLRLTRAAWLAAASDYQPQDWSSLLPARAGFLSMTLTSLETWPGIRARSFPRRAGANRQRDHSLRVVAAKRSRAHSVPHQHFQKHCADVGHLSIALSKSGSSAGFKTSWKDLTFEAEPLSSDDTIHD